MKFDNGSQYILPEEDFEFNAASTLAFSVDWYEIFGLVLQENLFSYFQLLRREKSNNSVVSW
jgi:hypothetical protein